MSPPASSSSSSTSARSTRSSSRGACASSASTARSTRAPSPSSERARAWRPRAIILSGGPASVYGEGAPTVDPRIFELGVPVLGICYGLQLIAHLLGGKVERGERSASTAHARVVVEKPEGILHRFAKREALDVWMSPRRPHRRAAPGLPDHRRQRQHALLRRRQREAAHLRRAVPPRGRAHPARRRHPRARSSSTSRACSPTWTPGAFTEEAIAAVRDRGRRRRPRHLRPVGRRRLVGRGHPLPQGARRPAHVHLRRQRPPAPGRGRAGRRHVPRELPPEPRRGGRARAVPLRARGRHRPRAEAQDHRPRLHRGLRGGGREGRRTPSWLVQGTLYPDVIESVSLQGAERGHQEPPQRGRPAREDEPASSSSRCASSSRTRCAPRARRSGMPKDLLWRHPFPGPGLAVRCLGEVTEKRLEVLRAADAIVTDEIRAAGPLRHHLAGLRGAPAGQERRRHGRRADLRGDLRRPRRRARSTA